MELFEVKIPHSGSVENVEITDWLVSVGDVVAEGDSLADVSTDKVDTELEAPQGGKIAKFLYDEGTEVTVGTVVVLMAPADASDDDVSAALQSYQPLPVLMHAPAMTSTDPQLGQRPRRLRGRALHGRPPAPSASCHRPQPRSRSRHPQSHRRHADGHDGTAASSARVERGRRAGD